MTRSVFGKVMWVGRATVFLVGLAVILALVFGVAVTALAGTGVGAPFNLGKINSVNAISTLSGSVGNGPMLRLDNNSATGGATALNLQVEPGKQPMWVNSQTKVANLNSELLDGQDSSSFLGANARAQDSDKLDGKDSEQFWSGNTYLVEKIVTSQGGGNVYFGTVFCDAGDTVLGGGGGAFAFEDDLTESAPIFSPTQGQGWQTFVQDNGFTDNVEVEAVCADFPPLRP